MTQVIFDEAEVGQRITNESQPIEFMQSWHDGYLKWFCGFANAQSGKLGRTMEKRA